MSNQEISQKTNLELFLIIRYSPFIPPGVMREITSRRLGHLFNMPRTIEEFWAHVKEKDIDLLGPHYTTPKHPTPNPEKP